MFRRTFDEISEWLPDIRSMEVAMGLSVLVLIGALWLFSHDATAPARAAQEALRNWSGDETLDVGTPFIRPYVNPEGRRVYQRKLVCSRPGATPVFAAVVHRRNRHSIAGQMSRHMGLVEALQTGTRSWPAGGSDLFEACARIGP